MRPRLGIWIALAVAIVVLDQLTKHFATASLEYAIPVAVFPGFNLTLLHNTGAAFSLFDDQSGWQRWFFVVLASAVSLMIIVWMWRIRDQGPLVLIAGLALVLGGAIGNLLDRLLLGYVTDFIQVWFGSWAFPSFNVADSAITVGAVLLIIDALFVSGRAD